MEKCSALPVKVDEKHSVSNAMTNFVLKKSYPCNRP
jgi:hypothetical protein